MCNYTVETYSEYIQNKIVGKNIPGHKNYQKPIIITEDEIKESEEQYNKNSILQAIAQLQAMIRGDHDSIGNALNELILNTDEIRDETSGLQNNLKEFHQGINKLNQTLESRLSARNS